MTTLSPSSAAKPAAKGGRVHNFNAGPSVLPEEVIKQIQEDIWNFHGSGIGILEHSHRGKVYEKVLSEAEATVRELASVPSNYKILFMSGGATSQSWILAANLLPKGRTADYLVTGYWAEKSVEDAKQYCACHNTAGQVHVAASSVDKKHTYIPAGGQIKYSATPAYVHMTSNNTIYGTQYHAEPAVPAGVPLVCDASSDIYSRPIDVSKYGMLYGGAQKNLGTTGATFVIIRDDLIDGANKDIPRMVQYRTFAKDMSMPNTPPAFAIYTVGLMAKWIKAQGGLAAMAKRNEEKAGLIYDALDAASGFWVAPVARDSRSLMNIVFRAKAGEAMDKKFQEEAKAHGMDGMAGHRATGGMRASTYNALPKQACVDLAQFIRDFAAKNG